MDENSSLSFTYDREAALLNYGKYTSTAAESNSFGGGSFSRDRPSASMDSERGGSRYAKQKMGTT